MELNHISSDKKLFGRNVAKPATPRIPDTKDIKLFSAPGCGISRTDKKGDMSHGRDMTGTGGRQGDISHGRDMTKIGRYGPTYSGDVHNSSVWTMGNHDNYVSGRTMNQGNIIINSVVKANTGHANSHFLNEERKNYNEVLKLGTDYANYLGSYGWMG